MYQANYTLHQTKFVLYQVRNKKEFILDHSLDAKTFREQDILKRSHRTVNWLISLFKLDLFIIVKLFISELRMEKKNVCNPCTPSFCFKNTGIF